MSICENTQAVTMEQEMPCIKTIGWLKQIRMPIEKD